MIVRIDGFDFEVENGKIVAASQCDKTIRVGDEVVNVTTNYGIEKDKTGKVLSISFPFTEHLTSNIFEVDFDGFQNIGYQMKLEDIVIDEVLQAEYIYDVVAGEVTQDEYI